MSSWLPVSKVAWVSTCPHHAWTAFPAQVSVAVSQVRTGVLSLHTPSELPGIWGSPHESRHFGIWGSPHESKHFAGSQLCLLPLIPHPTLPLPPSPGHSAAAPLTGLLVVPQPRLGRLKLWFSMVLFRSVEASLFHLPDDRPSC